MKKLFIAVLVTVLTLGITGCGSQRMDSGDSTVKENTEQVEEVSAPPEEIPTPEEVSAPTEETSTPEENSTPSEENISSEVITLDADNPGDNAEYMIFNEGTEGEDRALIFRIEPGAYLVTNAGSYISQFNVYKDEKNVSDYGWEEWVTGEDGSVTLIDVNETKEINIKEGYIVHLDSPSKFNLVKE